MRLSSGSTPRLAVLCDLLEERWFSMDLLADMLLDHSGVVSSIAVERVRPALPAGLSRLATSAGEGLLERWSRKLGLALGRYVAYPASLLARRSGFDFFHVADHSYAHLVLELPGVRSGVYCHDIDAFRPLLEKSRPSFPRVALAHALLAGLRRARVVFHSTQAVRDDILKHELVPAERLVHAPYGVASEFVPEPNGTDKALSGHPTFILHVGSLIPRKNPEFLLKLAIELCRSSDALHVVQIGGRFSSEQRGALVRENVSHRVRQIESLGRAELAPYYRAARAVVLPSTAEGFGLPVIEALACGTPVVASDIPVLAQVGGDGVVLCKVNDLQTWSAVLREIVAGRGPKAESCTKAAARYSWKAHAQKILGTYSALAAPS